MSSFSMPRLSGFIFSLWLEEKIATTSAGLWCFLLIRACVSTTPKPAALCILHFRLIVLVCWVFAGLILRHTNRPKPNQVSGLHAKLKVLDK